MAQEEKIDSVKIYFNQISKHPLLTPKQELCLFKKIEDSEKELKQLLCRRKTKKLSQKIYYLKRKIHSYKQKIFKANLRLVVWVAKKHSHSCHSCLSFLDLVQEGNIGLKKGVDKFDYKKGNKFSTFAPYWIMKYIKKGVAKVSRPSTWPLEIVGEEGEKINLVDIIPDRTTPSPENALLKILNIGERMQVLSTILSEQENTVFKLRYDPSEKGQIWSPEKIGNLYNITPGRVYQIEQEAIRKIKETIKGWQQEGKF